MQRGAVGLFVVAVALEACGSGANGPAGPPGPSGTDGAVDAPLGSEPDAPVCVPMTCEQQGKTCGAFDDGCGQVLDCGPCPVGQWMPAPRVGHGSIRGISGTVRDDVYLVDEDGNIEHFDGTAWRPDGGVTVSLRSVWAVSRAHAWVSGTEGLVGRFDGSAWREEMSPGDGDINAIWGTSVTSMWAAGRYIANGPLRSWNGAQWSEPTLPPYEGQFLDRMNSLHGSDPDDIWMVGSRGLAFHKTAAGWTKEETGAVGELTSVFAVAPDAAFAVGPRAFVRWDGHGWRPVGDDPNVAVGLEAVWASNRDDVWAVGTDGAMVHLQGDQVTRVPRVTTSHLLAIWGSAPDDIWAGGEGVLLHYGLGMPTDAGGPDLGVCGVVGSDCSKVDCCFPLLCARIKQFLVCE